MGPEVSLVEVDCWCLYMYFILSVTIYTFILCTDKDPAVGLGAKDHDTWSVL